MTSPRRRLQGTAIVAMATLVVAALAFSIRGAWGWFGVFHLDPPFADLVAILAAGQAREAGLDVYSAPNPFDPFGRPHVYGPGWLVTGTLGLAVKDAAWIGPLLAALFVGVASAVLAPRTRVEAVLAFLFLASPPALLGIERGNNDLIVFVLIAAAAWLLNRKGGAAGPGGAAILALAATLKLYPFAALPMIALPAGRRRRRAAAFLLLLGVCLVLVWIWRSDFLGAMRNVPKPYTVFAYGIQLIGRAWAGGQTDMVTAWAIGTAAGLVVFARRAPQLWHAVPTSGFTALAFFGGAICWIVCFVATNSYAYRAVLLLLCARLWLRRMRDPDVAVAKTARWQVGFWLLFFWLGVPKTWWDEAVANPGAGHPLFVWRNVVAGLEEGLATGLTLALAVSVAGLGWRRWQVRDRPEDG